MRVEVRATNFELSQALRRHVETRLRLAFGAARGEIVCARACLSGEGRGRTVTEPRCRVELDFAQAPALVVEETEANLYFAVDRACERALRHYARVQRRRRPARALAAAGASV